MRTADANVEKALASWRAASGRHRKWCIDQAPMRTFQREPTYLRQFFVAAVE